MSSTKPSTVESLPLATLGSTPDLYSSGPLTIRVTLAALGKALKAKRKALVKERRNALNRAAKDRAAGKTPPYGLPEKLLARIREIDERLGMLEAATNERSWSFEINIMHPDVLDLGFGLDDNGSYPAL